MLKLSTIASAILCLCLALYLSLTGSPINATSHTTQSPLLHILELLFPSSPVSAFPHSASWGSWWQPQSPITRERSGRSKWNLLYHLGGYGPWIEMIDGVSDAGEHGIGPPPGCVVDGVHMMSRHAERYPTLRAGGRHRNLLQKIQNAGLIMNGSLAFVNNWTYFTDRPEDHFGQLTRTGPYAGTLQAFTTGVRLRTRYSHLVPSGRTTRFWASDSNRVIETAKYFAAGFFDLNWESDGLAALEVIPETAEREADTLTPGDTCTNYVEDLEFGHDYGVNTLIEFHEVYIPAISERLAVHNPNINFTNYDVFSMQEMCGFETLLHGSSSWCDVFTQDDWLHFEYARDLVHYYRGGPGNRFGPVMGWLWLNATTELLLSPPEAGQLYFSFVHDGDIGPMLAALDIFQDDFYDPKLPKGNIATDRKWRASQIMPMGGRIILERLSCPSTASEEGIENENLTKQFIRINVNDGIIALPGCNSGPGHSCPLAEFSERVRLRGIEAGDFGTVCGLADGHAKRISFLHQ